MGADMVQVMLMGAHDDFPDDAKMQVTVAFNHFGKGLVQRMPRQITVTHLAYFFIVFLACFLNGKKKKKGVL